MGVPRGITLIVGGGYHGKSTLLRALETGVYDHIPGDGREQVVAVHSAVKIRAEDGRAVHAVDISAFISHLPGGHGTESFSTELASGSTSQAAALVEAIEAGSSCLLLDEDTSATNFMIRDRRMQELVAKTSEPITPFVDRIRELRDQLGLSTLLVMGGSGDYFDHADLVLQMDGYRPREVTDRAHEIASDHVTGRREERESDLTAAGDPATGGAVDQPRTAPGAVEDPGARHRYPGHRTIRHRPARGRTDRRPIAATRHRLDPRKVVRARRRPSASRCPQYGRCSTDCRAATGSGSAAARTAILRPRAHTR